MKKYFIITLEIRDGESEYYRKSVVGLNKGQRINSVADNEAKEYFGSSKKIDGVYWDKWQTRAVQVDGYQGITEDEYNVLVKYL